MNLSIAGYAEQISVPTIVICCNDCICSNAFVTNSNTIVFTGLGGIIQDDEFFITLRNYAELFSFKKIVLTAHSDCRLNGHIQQIYQLPDELASVDFSNNLKRYSAAMERRRYLAHPKLSDLVLSGKLCIEACFVDETSDQIQELDESFLQKAYSLNN